MDRRQLEYFVAVVEAGSLAAAAAEMHITQPALSQAIRVLEVDVGCELFHRLPRGMKPTAAGRALLGPAREVLTAFAVAHTAVADVVGLASGTIEIATLPGLVIDPLAGWIRVFRQTAPGIRVRLRQFETSDEIADAVRRGDAEAGLTIRSPSSPHLTSMRVGEQELVAVLPPGVEAAADISLEEMLDFGMVASGEQSVPRELVGPDAGEALAGTLTAVDVERRESALALILAGVGAGILPRAFGTLAAARGAEVRPLRPAIVRPVYVVRRDAPLTPTGRAFLEAIRVDGIQRPPD